MIYDKDLIFNKKQTFATYAVGDANAKAVKAVQELMTGNKRYRAVFIYGKTGYGKTHLAKAVEKQLLEKEVMARLRNQSDFTEELLGWFRHGGTIEDFYENYSILTDVFIIEDIQDFAKNPAAARYCKELIKRLLKEKKRVLLTADCRKAIRHWPGCWFARKIKIKDPDKKLKKEILRKCGNARKFHVPEEVLEFLSGREEDIVELLNMLIEGMAYDKILGEKLDGKLIERIWERRMSQNRRENSGRKAVKRG